MYFCCQLRWWFWYLVMSRPLRKQRVFPGQKLQKPKAALHPKWLKLMVFHLGSFLLTTGQWHWSVSQANVGHILEVMLKPLRSRLQDAPQ